MRISWFVSFVKSSGFLEKQILLQAKCVTYSLIYVVDKYGKISVKPHTVLKLKRNWLLSPLFSLCKKFVHNEVGGCLEILPPSVPFFFGADVPIDFSWKCNLIKSNFLWCVHAMLADNLHGLNTCQEMCLSSNGVIWLALLEERDPSTRINFN